MAELGRSRFAVEKRALRGRKSTAARAGEGGFRPEGASPELAGVGDPKRIAAADLGRLPHPSAESPTSASGPALDGGAKGADRRDLFEGIV